MLKSVAFWCASLLLLGALPVGVLMILTWSETPLESDRLSGDLGSTSVSFIGPIAGLMAGAFLGTTTYRESHLRLRSLALPTGALIGSYLGLSVGLSVWPAASHDSASMLVVFSLVLLGGIAGILLGSRFVAASMRSSSSSFHE